MRRTDISPEFIYNKVNGTYNMVERSSFFGSKMIKIIDSISISNENIIYYQLPSGEQIDLKTESTLPQVVYDAVSDKGSNQSLSIDMSQSSSLQLTNTKWIVDINIGNILQNYLFATIKQYRSFEGVTNDIILYSSVSSAIGDYINKNIAPKYEYSSIDFYLSYVDLSTIGGMKYNNNFDSSIDLKNNLFTKIQTQVASDKNSMRVLFSQQKPSSLYAFKYYFNIHFNRI